MPIANEMLMRISVIISTYNNPDWLEKALWGYAAQTERDFDIIIADDGSSAETKERIDVLRGATGLPITHLWHEDRGFRKCAIVNRAIRVSAADYLIFTDGDCIPRRDLVQAHRRLAQPGCFLSGGYYKLPLKVSRAITPEDIRANAVFDARWLLKAGVPFHPRLLKFHLSARVAAFCCRFTTTPATFNGMNSSVWREDALRLNGFDERMRHGGLDREFGLRLLNAGLRSLQIRYHAICLHLYHGHGYRTPASVDANHAIRQETVRTRRVWAEYGITQDPERS